MREISLSERSAVEGWSASSRRVRTAAFGTPSSLPVSRTPGAPSARRPVLGLAGHALDLGAFTVVRRTFQEQPPCQSRSLRLKGLHRASAGSLYKAPAACVGR